MEQFEKWKDDNCVKHCNLCYIGVCGDCVGIGTKEDTWRAALKWAKSRSTNMIGCKRTINTSEIERELED